MIILFLKLSNFMGLILAQVFLVFCLCFILILFSCFCIVFAQISLDFVNSFNGQGLKYFVITIRNGFKKCALSIFRSIDSQACFHCLSNSELPVFVSRQIPKRHGERCPPLDNFSSEKSSSRACF